MNVRRLGSLMTLILCGLVVSAGSAEPYYLLTGEDARHYPGPERLIPPYMFGPVFDGDRLAGTDDVGPLVPYLGTGTPRYQPNYLGSLSMMYRRGHIPFVEVPLLGIEFLGGPLLDLDGDPNTPRSFVPVPPAIAVELPETDSFVDLAVDLEAGTIELLNIDATGCNEGGPGIGPDIATIVVTIAGTEPDGSLTGPINPEIDTRLGTLTAISGESGTLTSVYRVADLGFEFWEDTLQISGTFDVLGTLQFLGTFQGWLVAREPTSGQFPTLAGEGLGSTRWPDVDTDAIGQVFNTAHGLAGGTATILSGVSGDDYTAPGNGGEALVDLDGDLGAYFDAVVVPRLPAAADRFVYLEAAGFGINNSGDPVFVDTVGYDIVLVAATASCGPWGRGDADCSGAVDFDDIDLFVAALSGEDAWENAVLGEGCTYLCVNDVNRDGVVDFDDIDPFVAVLSAGS